MAVTPWPFLPTGERDTFFCPYDTDGLAKVVLPGRGIYTASTAQSYSRCASRLQIGWPYATEVF